MVLPALSMSISHTSFQAELEGAILQQTASVDLYLQTEVAKWTPECYQHDGGCEPSLRSLFLSDLSSCAWNLPFAVMSSDAASPGVPGLGVQLPTLCHSSKRRPRAQPMQATGAGAQLEQFLQDDLHRFMELREQMEQQALSSDMAVLSSTAEERQRRLSSNSAGSNSGISFVRLPDDSMLDADDDDEGVEEHHPVAGALAAAAALAAVSSLASRTGSDALSSTASHSQQADPFCAAQQVEQPQAASSVQAPAAGHAEFVLEADEDIAAQKRAARARLAELEGSSASLSTPPGQDSAAASSAKACQDWEQQQGEAGSMHTSKVPERPRGLTSAPASKAPVRCRTYFERLVAKLCEFSSIGSDGVLLQHNQFLHHMVAGLLLCVVLLPVLWLLQADGGRGVGIVRGLLPAAFVAKAEQLFNALHVAIAGGVLLYCLARSLLLQPPLLHFREPVLERQYLLWSNSGRLFQDCLFQVTFLMVGGCLWLQLLQSGNIASAFASGQPTPNGLLLLSAMTLMGSGLPVVMLIVLRSPRYVQYRERLLAGSRLCSMVAVSLQLAGPGSQLQLNMPSIALAQVMSIACMQVRLSSFVPTQVLHLLVLLLCTRAANPLLQFTQLFGGWLCLPCVVLYSMEMHSRKAFLSTLAPPTAPGKCKALPAASALGKSGARRVI